MRKLFIIALLLGTLDAGAQDVVLQDRNGVLRWMADSSEVALFGANYCLPSASDYRAAGMINGTPDRKKMIEQDMAHFSRMGWDGLRLSFWGDWENSDHEGNLINNDHLDLLDYLVATASRRGIKMLLSPIITYSANWPDKNGTQDMPGFSAHYPKGDLILDKAAIAAQVNYVTQILNHVNPYTGRKLKDEPDIVLVEMINEPAQHTDKLRETTAYIDTMYDAIRRAGYTKPVFYNVSQNFDIAPAIRASKVQGATYAWYPTQLNNGFTLHGNILPYVSSYPQIAGVDVGRRARLVYEFDTPDVTAAYLYPAMVREYREGGVQFAALFSYDMLATAAWNMGWQTHNFNMIYTPQKALSAMIAARAMKELPLGKDHGEYPANNRFGNFLVDAASNLSFYCDGRTMMHTADVPKWVEAEFAGIGMEELQNIIGFGSSTVVEYDGRGIYFLERVSDGVWRLDVYPDAIQVSDPFLMPNHDKICFELFWRDHTMRLSLPDLARSFNVSPGGWLLSVGGAVAQPSAEYIVPDNTPRNRRYVQHEPPRELTTGHKAILNCTVASDREPVEVAVYIRPDKTWFGKHKMERTGDYEWSVALPTDRPAMLDYIICVDWGDQKTMYPSGNKGAPDDWDFYGQQTYSVMVAPSTAPIEIFNAGADSERMRSTRTFQSVALRRYSAVDAESGECVVGLFTDDISAKPHHTYPADVSGASWMADRIASRTAAGATPRAVVVRARSTTLDTGSMIFGFSQSDCAAWCAEVELSSELRDIEIPLEALRPGRAPMLPQDWPGVNPYWYPAPTNTPQTIEWSAVEKVFFSMREELYDKPDTPKGIEVVSIKLIY